ncbi:hypothetical protein [Neobacillus vireti]|uniref:DUF4367 domain-containing protein n=1 Tax=Neobacillus vireti LMG 21834 TaxID=1131730 RepID=A0AB94IUR4_9BACI|nr:hypothetical protein [Neobacillus vireti]ETI70791.1 hypothetical protein BAVI_00280 [Neobacillus vireti LMG 21834]KLT17669.1 hypothetical protein AA980_11160 [Neobacillus vireti]
MNGRQPLDYKLEDEIIWVDGRKDIVKEQLREEIAKKSRIRRPFLNWEPLKVSMSLVTVALLCVLLIGDITQDKNGFQEIHQAGSVSHTWHNLEIKPVLPPVDVKWGKFENFPNMVNSYKNFDLVESQKRASFHIMRPSININMPLEISRGVIEYPPFLTAKEFKGPITYWDIWHRGEKWVYVNQSLADNSRQLLSKKEKKVMAEIYSNAQFIPFKNKDAIAVLTDLGENGKRISMYVKSNKYQVIDFEIRGNINEEELIKLAKSYVEK